MKSMIYTQNSNGMKKKNPDKTLKQTKPIKIFYRIAAINSKDTTCYEALSAKLQLQLVEA